MNFTITNIIHSIFVKRFLINHVYTLWNTSNMLIALTSHGLVQLQSTSRYYSSKTSLFYLKVSQFTNYWSYFKANMGSSHRHNRHD